MRTQFHTVIFFVELFLYLLFATFLFTHKKGNTLSNRIFGGFLLSKALINIGVLCFYYRHSVYQTVPEIYVVISSFSFIIGPLLYLYTISILHRDFKIRPVYFFFTLPFILDVILKTSLYIQNSNAGQTLITTGGLIPPNMDELHSIINDLYVFACLGASIYYVNRYRSEIKKMYSSVEKIQLSWLKLVIIGFTLIQTFYLYKHVSLLILGSYLQSLTIWMHFSELIIVSIILYQILRWPEVFSGINHKPKYEKSSLNESDKNRYMKRLKEYIESEKPYLDPSITLFGLAEKTAIPSHHLSQILNTCLNQNFFDFINAYRIEESKKILSDKNNGKKTILEILYETGFNSKSVFNTAFKKHTGMTPSQFRNRQNT
ncbi:MAG: helix-turn-helix domain-containing protein [bacterium]